MMTPEEQASALAALLDQRTATDDPTLLEGLDTEVLEALYALRPELAPPARVSADDILSSLTEGPLADVSGEVAPETPVVNLQEVRRSRRQWLPWGTVLAAAAALVLFVRTGGEAPEAPAPSQEVPATRVAPAEELEDEEFEELVRDKAPIAGVVDRVSEQTPDAPSAPNALTEGFGGIAGEIAAEKTIEESIGAKGFSGAAKQAASARKQEIPAPAPFEDEDDSPVQRTVPPAARDQSPTPAAPPPPPEAKFETRGNTRKSKAAQAQEVAPVIAEADEEIPAEEMLAEEAELAPFADENLELRTKAVVTQASTTRAPIILRRRDREPLDSLNTAYPSPPLSAIDLSVLPTNVSIEPRDNALCTLSINLFVEPSATWYLVLEDSCSSAQRSKIERALKKVDWEAVLSDGPARFNLALSLLPK